MFYAWHRSRRRHSFRCCVTPVIVMPLPECLVSLLGITGFLVGALPGVDDFPVIGVPWMEAGGEKRQRIDHKSSGEDSRCEVQPLNGAQCRGDVRELPIFPEEIQPVTVHQRQEKVVPRASVAMRIA